MSDKTQDDAVGYGKPPKSNQFKRGQSGNPKGRPKGAKGVKASLRRELDSKITVREGGREVKLSKAEVLAKSLLGDALKGDAKARLEILKLDDVLYDAGRPNGDEPVAMPEAEEIDYKILRDFLSPQEDKPSGGEDDEN